ncbi:HET-domain-containing protein [Nemania abortiva]|nr:HET-domain-containing protein [Nemania abortiva]
MASPGDHSYSPLPNATSIRVLVLAPGDPDDSDISFGLITSDLDWDHDRFPDSTPRGVESISFITSEPTGDDEPPSQFPIYLDIDYETNAPERRMHPFQRYEALSYVWGDLIDPEYVFLDGGVPIPVTKNLHSALRSLRLRNGGRKLWIDALCINQSDYEEKKIQLGLMKRVYQQAEKVIAYLPLSPPDQKNINELVPQIMRASMLYIDYHKSPKNTEPDQEQYTGPLNSISDPETTTKVAVKEGESISTILANSLRDNKLYLESFGLPSVDSPLWDSWRRLFGSPYFRRIWIWQEVTLGNNLHIWFGNGEGDAEPLMFSHHFLDLYSASMTSSYNAAWCDSDEDNEATLKDRIVGSANATTMFRERILTRNAGHSRRRLIERLAAVGTFDAKDPRDKIYALLGLVSDGESFIQHVSYAPSDSVERIFARFAKLFMDRGEGIEVLLQAGLRDEEDEWPSWVPHWDSLERTVERDAARGQGITSVHMHVDESSQTLNVSGAILDDINVVNDKVLEALQVTFDGVSITRFLNTIARGFAMVFKTFTPRDPEEILNQLFYVLAQPEGRSKRLNRQEPNRPSSSQDGVDTSDSQREAESSTVALTAASTIEKEDKDTQILRTGFHEFLNYLTSLKGQISNAEEGVAQITERKSAAEYQAFMKKALATTSHRRLCVTKGGRIGMAPKRAKVGDCVAVFEGCDIHFVLRRVGNSLGKSPNEGEEGGNDKATYKLVGPAYFYMPDDETGPPGTSMRTIRIK